MPASIIDSPWTRSRKSPFVDDGIGTYSSMCCSASSGPPAAICPTSGRRVTSSVAGSDAGAGRASRRSRPISSSARGLVGSRLSRPGALEVRKVRVHRRRRREPDVLADLAHRRRVAVPVDVLDEEVPDLLLPGGEQGASEKSLTNVCSPSSRDPAERVNLPSNKAGVGERVALEGAGARIRTGVAPLHERVGMTVDTVTRSERCTNFQLAGGVAVSFPPSRYHLLWLVRRRAGPDRRRYHDGNEDSRLRRGRGRRVLVRLRGAAARRVWMSTLREPSSPTVSPATASRGTTLSRSSGSNGQLRRGQSAGDQPPRRVLEARHSRHGLRIVRHGLCGATSCARPHDSRAAATGPNPLTPELTRQIRRSASAPGACSSGLCERPIPELKLHDVSLGECGLCPCSHTSSCNVSERRHPGRTEVLPRATCAGEDLNLHAPKGHKALNLARLPIPPPARGSGILDHMPR